MRSARILAISAILALVAPFAAPVSAAEGDSRIPTAAAARDNAALQYWMAFHFLPDDDGPVAKLATHFYWGDDPEGDPVVSSLPEDTRSTPVRFLLRGAGMPGCDWGIDVADDGAGSMVVPHITEARKLGRYAALIAWDRARRGAVDEAVGDLLAVVALARHLQTERATMIEFIVGSSIERLGMRELAALMPALGDDVRKRIGGRLERLAMTPASKPFLVERSMAERLRQELVAADDPLPLMAELGADQQMLKWLLGDDRAAPQDPRERILAAFGEHLTLMDEVAAALDLPADGFVDRMGRIDARVETNPLAKLLMPSVRSFRSTYERQSTQHRLLCAAARAVRLEPEDAILRAAVGADGTVTREGAVVVLSVPGPASEPTRGQAKPVRVVLGRQWRPRPDPAGVTPAAGPPANR